MIRYFNTYEGKLRELQQTERYCWIHIYPPFNHEHLKSIAEKYAIPIDFLIDSLDIDERARYEKEDDVSLIVIKTPIQNLDNDQRNAAYITIPIGIILAEGVIITISPYENPVINEWSGTR